MSPELTLEVVVRAAREKEARVAQAATLDKGPTLALVVVMTLSLSTKASQSTIRLTLAPTQLPLIQPTLALELPLAQILLPLTPPTLVMEILATTLLVALLVRLPMVRLKTKMAVPWTGSLS